MRTDSSQIRQSAPPLAHFEDENRVSKHQADKPLLPKEYFQGFDIQTSELNDEHQGVNNGLQEDQNSSNINIRNKLQSKPLLYRIWKYLKNTWTGVLTGNEPVVEELELPHRYRPDNLVLLCEATGFSVKEMKRIYRGFKTECPTGLITEEVFQGIYSRFFPHGAPFLWKDCTGGTRYSIRPFNMKLTKKEKKDLLQSQPNNFNAYSHYVFCTLDQDESGIITFEDFVLGLSILVKGCLEDKLRWIFSLYDQDKDGYISRMEMEEVVASVFDLMGKTSEPQLEEEFLKARVDNMFHRMDLNGDGLVSMEEFLQVTLQDDSYCQSISAFSNVLI